MEVESDAGRLHACSSIPHYTKQEGEKLEKLLREEEAKIFTAAVHTLDIWLERRERNEENKARFAILFQLCFDGFVKLLAMHKESICKLMKKRDNIQIEANEIEKIFNIVEKKGFWDNFTPNQRKELKHTKTDVTALKQNVCPDDNTKQKLAEMENYQRMTLILKMDCLINQLNTTKIKIDDLAKEASEIMSQLQGSKKLYLITDVAWLSFQEAELIALLSCFLVQHPGVDVEFISLNLKAKYPIDKQELKKIMEKYPRIFEESSLNETTKIWNCVGAPLDILKGLKNKNAE